MSLPDLSYMMSVGQLRYIQSTYETEEYCNPDTFVRELLSPRQRLACLLRGKLLRARLRGNPFYHYVLARTKYYDQVFLDAVRDSCTSIINIGSGSDTRAYRFAKTLKQEGVTVIECDQAQAIYAKQEIARQHWVTDHVRYFPLDLNDPGWEKFARLLDERSGEPVLIMMEGVSPYISSDSFEEFLSLLAIRLNPRSLLAYDFKIKGSAESLGRSKRVRQPFRLSADRYEVTTFHERLGFELLHMELSTELLERILPVAPSSFGEDCLLRLRLHGAENSR